MQGFMAMLQGRVTELSLNAQGRREAWITWTVNGESPVLPAPGQYLMAWSPDDRSAPLATVCYPAGLPDANHPERQEMRVTAEIPDTWSPGTPLLLRGPLGRGFSPPREARRVALAAVADSPSRLLPLVPWALDRRAALTLFSDSPLPPLPAAVEIIPLSGLAEALSWADYLAVDLERGQLERVRSILGLAPGEGLPCPAQALVSSPVPCGGMSGCGACAVPGRGHHWRLACEDGPVFDLAELAW